MKCVHGVSRTKLSRCMYHISMQKILIQVFIIHGVQNSNNCPNSCLPNNKDEESEDFYPLKGSKVLQLRKTDGLPPTIRQKNESISSSFNSTVCVHMDHLPYASHLTNKDWHKNNNNLIFRKFTGPFTGTITIWLIVIKKRNPNPVSIVEQA